MDVERERKWVCSSFVGQMRAILEKKGISKSELGQRIGKTDAYASQVLNRPKNLTMNTMLEFAHAAGYRMFVALYEYNPEMLPSHASPVEAIITGKENVTEDNFMAVLSKALEQVDGIEAVFVKGPRTLAIEVDGDQVTMPQAFTIIAYIEALVNKHINVHIKYVDSEDEVEDDLADGDTDIEESEDTLAPTEESE